MIRDLTQLAVRMVEDEKIAEVQAQAREAAIERILEIMQPMPHGSAGRIHQRRSRRRWR